MVEKPKPKQPKKDNEEKQSKDILEYDPDNINIVAKEPTIEQLLRRIDEKALDLAPDFQRHADLWKDEVKSRLIESIIIRIPLPAFYIDGTNEDNWLVVDGLQRLSALKQFVSNKSLKLTGLEYLQKLEGKTYDELDRKYQRRIEETQVTVYLIDKGTPDEVKYNIFKRINTGGEPLERQEIRHALNPGPAPKLLAYLAKSSEFKHLVKLSQKSQKRMEDREFVLGAIAVMRSSYKDYAQMGRESFLDDAMKKINKLSEEEIKEVEKKFKKTLVACSQIFGDTAFRKTSVNRVNKALFEACFFNISKLNGEQIEKLIVKKEDLIKKRNESVNKNSKFFKSMPVGDRRISRRFTIIEKIIEEVLND